MIQKHPHQISKNIGQAQSPSPIKVSSLQSISALARFTKNEVVADYAEDGTVRTIAADDLFPTGKGATALDTAKAFIESGQGQRALQLRYINLALGEVAEFDKFTRVEFKQFVKFAGTTGDITVRGGYIHVVVTKDLRVISVTSTVRRGRKPRSLGRTISPAVATALAKSSLDSGPTEVVSTTLVLSAHDECLNPIFEVVLSSENPRQVVLFLVDAKSGEVVHKESKLHFRSTKQSASDGIPVLSFPQIPDGSKDVKSQVRQVFIDPAELPDRSVLANERYKMLVLEKGKWVPVKANDKGTFEFDATSTDALEVSKFSAALTFDWLNGQDATLESWGAVRVPNPIPVFMDDPSVQDNAYFDPMGWEIHMGVGSGLKAGGLTKHISWDTGVGCHENTHKRNAAEAPGKDLPGVQGEGANEATADMFGDVLFDLWNRFLNGGVLGHQLTIEDIINESAVIGKYCMFPKGIRTQRNTKQFPKDMRNEPHADGLIIGGAFLDLLVALASAPEAVAEDVLVTYGKLFIQGTRLLPAHKVLFTDYVRAFITADGVLTGGKNKELIVNAFAGHGIKLQTVSAGKTISFTGNSKKRGPQAA